MYRERIVSGTVSVLIFNAIENTQMIHNENSHFNLYCCNKIFENWNGGKVFINPKKCACGNIISIVNCIDSEMCFAIMKNSLYQQPESN